MKSGLQLGVNSETKREPEDFYATQPKALEIFLDKLNQDNIILNNQVWECACGQGHLAKVLIERGFIVNATDLVDRGYGVGNIDFLGDIPDNHFMNDCDILTNPPFNLAEKFVEKSMEILKPGNKLFLFLKIQFLEGQKRKELFKKYPPKYLYCYSARQLCSRNGEFDKYIATTQFYAWYIWEKGFVGEPIVRWI